MTSSLSFADNNSSSSFVLDSPKKVVPVKYIKPSILPIFGRVIILFITLIICLIISATWWSWGYSWIIDIDLNTIPLYECPNIKDTFIATSTAPDGPRCQVSLPLKESFMKIIDDAGFAIPEGLPINERRGKCVIPSEGKREDAEIICYSYDTCNDACTIRGTNNRCPDPKTLNEEIPFNEKPIECSVYMRNNDNSRAVDITANCIEVKDGSYCNNIYTITPANVVTIRGLICGVVIITLFWFIAEFILRHVDIGLRKEKAEGMAKMDKELPEKIRYLRNQLESRWDEALMLSIEEGKYTSSAAVTAAVVDEGGGNSYETTEEESGTQINERQQQQLTTTMDRIIPLQQQQPIVGGESATSLLTCSITLANTNYQTPIKSTPSPPPQQQEEDDDGNTSPITLTPFTLSAMWTPATTTMIMAAEQQEVNNNGLTTTTRRTLQQPQQQQQQYEYQGYPLCVMSSRQSINGGGGDGDIMNNKDPRKRYESNAWKRRIKQWKELKTEKMTTYRNKQLSRTILLNIFFILLITVTLYLIIYFSPQQLKTQRTVLEAVIGNVSIWEVSTWLDLLIFIDVLLDVMLFLIACIVVKWPGAPLFSRHIQDVLKNAVEAEQTATTARRREGKKIIYGSSTDDDDDDIPSEGGYDDGTDDGIDDDVSDIINSSSNSTDTKSIEFVLEQNLTSNCCLMIACHLSTMTNERYNTFTNTLRAAMSVFPPSHIFVCDNGPSLLPQDQTQWATQEVHPDINYLYTPEGNKTFAFYWCNKYWIPYLEDHGRIPSFTYAVIIDDDVPLPSDLHIPQEQLMKDPTIKAVHFPITAASPDGDPNILVKCQDIEYKMAAVHKLFQAKMARCLSCHGAIALWDRESLDEIFYQHDTVFNGEDMYMGLSLLRKRDDSKIISCAQAIVPTYAPDSWMVLFRQRVKSWELTSHKKTFSYFFEVFHPASFCHKASLALKPYFLQELLAVILDWLRVFLLCGLLLRDWLGLILMTMIFNTVLYIAVAVFQLVVLRERKELRCTLCTYILFPWYRLNGLLFRLGALCQNLLVYSHERTNIKIGVREDEIRDIPPCPPHPDVDWFTVWVDDNNN